MFRHFIIAHNTQEIKKGAVVTAPFNKNYSIK